MSLKKNTIANYLGQSYKTLISIIMLPLYLRYLGAEAFGLVGFFSVLQAWLSILDFGLSPTLSRQVAYQRGCVKDGLPNLRQLVRSIEIMFGALAVFIVFGISWGSKWIATQWLTLQAFSHSEVTYCISLMGVMVGLRWFISLYRSGIQGMEQMVWLNMANIVLATIRFVVAYALLRWVSHDIRHFFEFQLGVSLIEFLVMLIRFYGTMPQRKRKAIGFSWPTFRAILPFTGGIAYTSALWVLLTQLDKLILSHFLTLKAYGYFALVAVISNALLSFTEPISEAILPRMTLLLSEGKEALMLDLYRKTTQFVGAFIFPAAGITALFSTELLYAWTGDKAAAEWGGPVLKWFSLGNGFLAIGAFQYYLQYAYGKLKLHVVNTTINALLQVPLLAYAAYCYGAIGVAHTWFVIRIVAFIIWPAIVHSRFAPGLHSSWLKKDIAPGLLVTGLCLAISCFERGALLGYDRWLIVILLLGLGLFIVLANILVLPECRSQIVTWLNIFGRGNINAAHRG